MDLLQQVRDTKQRELRHASVRRVTRPLLWISIVVFGLLGGAFAFERYSQQSVLSKVEDQLAAGGMASLFTAERTLAKQLEPPGWGSPIRAISSKLGLARGVSPAPARALLALVRARLIVGYDQDSAPAKASLGEKDLDTSGPEWHILRAALAFADGDAERSKKAIELAASESDEAARDSDTVEQHAAWLAGLAALHFDPTDEGRIAALQQLSGADPEYEAWPAYTVLQVRLFQRVGNLEQARSMLSDARARHTASHNLAAAELWMRALMHESSKEVVISSDQLLATEEALGPRARSLALLARGTARFRVGGKGGSELGLADLVAAWTVVPAWDLDTRLLAIESAFEAGAWQQAQLWLTAVRLPSAEQDIFQAWLTFAGGDASSALGSLAQLTQTHPRVAYLQALGLVEESRWNEAPPWITRSRQLLAGRPELAVAQARTSVHLGVAGDKPRALESLKQLAVGYPYAARVWTALGEAHLAVGGESADEEAKAAFKTATERERLPAEAWMQLGALLAKEGDDIATAQAVLTAYQKAAEANPYTLRYGVVYGRQLAHMGFPRRAFKMWLPLADAPRADGKFLLELVELAAARARYTGTAPHKKTKEWMERAAALGAAPRDLVMARARLDLASLRRKNWARARDQLGALVAQQGDDHEARYLLGLASLRNGDAEGAAATAEVGLKRARGVHAGRLYMLLAAAEHKLDNRRAAARNSWRGFKKLRSAGASPRELVPAAAKAVEYWFLLEQPSSARNIVRDLSKHVPYHSGVWSLRGRVQLQAGFPGPSCESASKSLALDAEHAGGWALQGACHKGRGQKDEARAAYKKAIKLAGGKRERQAYRKELRGV